MTAPLPSLYVPHGAPTFALHPGAAGAALKTQADALPRPRAIIIVSTHWQTETATVGTADRLETIHDFAGFPDALVQPVDPTIEDVFVTLVTRERDGITGS